MGDGEIVWGQNCDQLSWPRWLSCAGSRVVINGVVCFCLVGEKAPALGNPCYCPRTPGSLLFIASSNGSVCDVNQLYLGTLTKSLCQQQFDFLMCAHRYIYAYP